VANVGTWQKSNKNNGQMAELNIQPMLSLSWTADNNLL
jgi:hypothetical protein